MVNREKPWTFSIKARRLFFLGNWCQTVAKFRPVIDSRKRQSEMAAEDDRHDAGAVAAVSLFSERKQGRPKKENTPKRATMSRQEVQQLEAQREGECATYFSATDMLVDAMRRGEKDAENAWLINAEKLLEMFRGTRPLFPSSSVCARGS